MPHESSTTPSAQDIIEKYDAERDARTLTFTVGQMCEILMAAHLSNCEVRIEPLRTQINCSLEQEWYRQQREIYDHEREMTQTCLAVIHD